MSDLIRREDVLRLAESGKLLSGSFGERAKDIIKAIPTANPKVGKRKIEEMDTVWGKGYRLICLQCGDVLTVTEDALPYERYCRCCGVLIERSER